MKHSTYVYSAPHGGQYLVTVWGTGRVSLAYRETQSDSWGPPMELIQHNEWNTEDL